MQNFRRLLCLSLKKSTPPVFAAPSNGPSAITTSIFRALSSRPSDGDGGAGSWTDGWDTVGSSSGTGRDPSSPDRWDSVSSWSTGLTKDYFDGEAVGRQITPVEAAAEATASSAEVDLEKETEELERANRRSEAFLDGWDDRMTELSVLMKQVREPGSRGSYLKDSEKAEMYRKHKEDPETYTVERLAKEYRIMRQRVHAILWLKELEEEEEKKLGRPLDDSVEVLLDTCPE